MNVFNQNIYNILGYNFILSVTAQEVRKLVQRYAKLDPEGVDGITYDEMLTLPEFAGNSIASPVVASYLDSRSQKIYPKQFLMVCAMLSTKISVSEKKKCEYFFQNICCFYYQIKLTLLFVLLLFFRKCMVLSESYSYLGAGVGDKFIGYDIHVFLIKTFVFSFAYMSFIKQGNNQFTD